jgi:uncharacterized protein YceK
MRRMCALVLATLLMSGCGTITQGHMLKGPAIFGGIRMDVAILADGKTRAGSKVMAVLDLLFCGSLALDVCYLPFSVPNEIIEMVCRDGIDVRPPVHWDDPQPKRTEYSAPPEKRVTEMPGETILRGDAGI